MTCLSAYDILSVAFNPLQSNWKEYHESSSASFDSCSFPVGILAHHSPPFYLRTWIDQFRSKPSIAKRKGKNKSRPCPFPAKRPEYPLCKAKEGILPSEATPEPPPLIVHRKGRRRSIDTDMHFCPNNDCEYYSWLARGNICSNGHPNSGRWRQLKCIVCGTFFIIQETALARPKGVRPWFETTVFQTSPFQSAKPKGFKSTNFS